MAVGKSLRMAALVLSNALIPIAVLVFATGFFPYKPVLPGLATFDDVQESDVDAKSFGLPEAVFDRAIFMVVDALRSDFVYGEGSGFGFVQSLIRSGSAIPFTAHASPPTVTMPRVKALTTGSVPSFLDLILNFAESDTSSSLAGQDTWVGQIKAKKGVTGEYGRVVFYGDDTWLKLFPDLPVSEGAAGDTKPFFARADGTTSFFVSDFTEVDNNVTRHVAPELQRADWDAMILHYLGLDHIGHKTGPNGPNMLPKQREMDAIVRMIYEAMETHEHHRRTLLVLAGDHGMNAGGNHGGSGPGETEPALVFLSPRFNDVEKARMYECPTQPKEGTEFHFYTKIQQSDLVPALAGMMGMPVSKNSLGVFQRELGNLWSEEERVGLLVRNARQLLGIIRAKFGEGFERRVEESLSEIKSEMASSKDASGDEERLVWAWAEVLNLLGRREEGRYDERLEQVLYRFLELAQETMSDTASSYDIPRMGIGMAVITVALVLAVVSFPSFWPPTLAGTFLTFSSLLYGIMMFASSYVEEEQHIWYWATPVWITLLVAKQLRQRHGLSSSIRTITSGVIIIALHRLAVRWNQTGQKHAGEPDIVHAFFPDHHISMWILILATYLMIGYMVHFRTCSGLMAPELTALIDTVIAFPIIFKLNFTQADAPELVLGLAERLREMTEVLTLVLQARISFVMVFLAAVLVTTFAWRRSKGRHWSDLQSSSTAISLTERLHPLFALFLMTQTRAPNIPLFLLFELQWLCLQRLLSPPPENSKQLSLNQRASTAEIAVTVLLLSHTYYFCMGGSNSISSIDLSNAYNGVADYNIAAVGILLFASNWAGPLWWCSAAVLLYDHRAEPASPPIANGKRNWVTLERTKLHVDAVSATRKPGSSSLMASESASWSTYITCMTTFIATALLAVMAACTALRTHLFIWTVFSPKYLYALAWSVGWHLLVNVGLGSVLWWLCGIRS